MYKMLNVNYHENVHDNFIPDIIYLMIIAIIKYII